MNSTEFLQDFIIFSAVNVEKPLILGIWSAIFGLLAIILDILSIHLFAVNHFLKLITNLKVSILHFLYLIYSAQELPVSWGLL